MKDIYVIAPLVETESAGITAEAMRQSLGPLGIEDLVRIIPTFIPEGPSSIETELDDALCIPHLLREAIRAKAEGAAGILVNCMCDPGVKALRCIMDIPVMGPAETAFHLAAALGHRFSVVDIGTDTAPMVENQVSNYGLERKFASIRGTGISVEDIHSSDKTYAELSKAARLAVEQDGADVIVLGCTGFIGCAEAVRSALLDSGHDVPVIDPLPLAVRTLVGIVLEGHCHSKKAFPTPEKTGKRLQGYAEEDPLCAFYSTQEK